MSKEVVIIGGGVAGTAAAHELTQRGYSVTIVEQRDYIGGRIHSHIVDGAAVEMGAGFMTKGYANLLDFMRTNGLSELLHRQHGQSGILRDGKIYMATFGTLLKNKPLSWGAKVQAMVLVLKALTSWKNLDPHAFWKASKYDDRSVNAMFPSKSGKELLEYAVQPTLNGYFYWTPEYTSEAMLRILCKAAFSHGTYKMRGGLQGIPEKAAENSKVLLNHTVKRVQRTAGEGYEVHIEHEGKASVLRADGVICATTANVVAKILPDLVDKQKAFFDAVQYSSTALVARTYSQAQTIGDKAIAFPRREQSILSTITVAPEPSSDTQVYATVKTYASGADADKLMQLSDGQLAKKLVDATALVRDHVLIGDPQPVATHIQRWREALPYFDVGHFKRLQQFEGGKIENPNQPLTFAGDYLGGPFMEGAYTSGVQAAERLDARLQK